jgi:hypothetical protein
MVAHRRSKFRNELVDNIAVDNITSLSNSTTILQENSTVYNTLISVLSVMDKIKDDVKELFG